MDESKKRKPIWRVRNIVLLILLALVTAAGWIGFDLYRLINAPPEADHRLPRAAHQTPRPPPQQLRGRKRLG